MHFVGVDLAWGLRARTGLAVLEEDGRLRDLVDVRTDEEILQWLRGWTDGPCLVAFDAPLIVRNAAGMRECERLVARYFARYRLGAHAANTANVNFANGDTRALRLATALGLDVNPTSRAERRAIEVYPHPAIIMLFDLPGIVQYKQKQGRDLARLRGEMTRLADYLERLAEADVPLRVAEHPGWQKIRTAVVEASRKADLKRVENMIDAVVCAYVARYAVARPEAVRILGSVEDGYILTPVTGEIAAVVDCESRAAG